jgi:serine/threonine protein kinase
MEDLGDEEWWKDSKTAQLQLAIRNALEKVHQDDLERIKVLGEGQFGEVWLVAADLQLQLDSSNDVDESKSESNIHEERYEFALKLQETYDEFRYETATSELNIMKEVSASGHPFVSMLYRSYETEESKDMLMGLIPGGELWDTIHKENEDTGEWLSGLSEGASRFYAMVVADTLDYLHSRHYVFRDLKPENIMLDGYGYPVVVDFGFCKCLPKGPDEKTFTFCGTPNYVAPEIILNVGHNSKVDCWALGIVIYEMITGINPFFYDAMGQIELYRSICEDDGEPLSEKNHSRQVRRLIEGLLAKDPSKRMGVRDILGHSWFEGLSLKRLRKRQIRAPWIPPGGKGETAEYCSDSDQEAAVSARKREQEVEAEILRRKQEEEERFRKQQLQEEEEEARRLEEERLRLEEEERLRQEEELCIQQELEERRKREEEEEEEERRREEEKRLMKEEELRLQRELEERQRIEKEEEEERRRLEEELRLQREQEEEEKRRREEELRLQKELEERQRLEEEEEERRREERLKRKAEEKERLRLEEQRRIEKEEEELLRLSPADSDFEDDEGDLPLRNGNGNSSRRWEFRQSPKRSSRRSIEELVSPVPKGIVSKLINDSSKNKSPNSRGAQSPGSLDVRRSVKKGLVAKRLSAAKEKEEPGNIPSLFASFSLLEN